MIFQNVAENLQFSVTFFLFVRYWGERPRKKEVLQMKTNCDIICDLLPLYADHVTSEASNALVEEHLSECPDCQKKLEQMQSPLPVKPEESAAAPLEKIRSRIFRNRICAILIAVCAVICLAAVSAKLYSAQRLVTVEEARIWTYNTRENGADLCNLDVQGEGVRIVLQEDFSWGKKVIPVRLVKFAFPRFHALLEPVVTSLFAQAPSEDTTIAVSNTQVLAVECADDTLYYRKGQPVYRYVTQNADGSVQYFYDSEDMVDGQFSRG